MLRIQVQIAVRHPRSGLALVLATIVAGAIGCRRGDLAAQRTAVRCEHLGGTISAMVESERRRPRQLTRGADMVGAALSRDIRAARATAEELRRCWRRDWSRWIADPPVYPPGAREFFEGKPENIESNAIILLF